MTMNHQELNEHTTELSKSSSTFQLQKVQGQTNSLVCSKQMIVNEGHGIILKIIASFDEQLDMFQRVDQRLNFQQRREKGLERMIGHCDHKGHVKLEENKGMVEGRKTNQ